MCQPLNQCRQSCTTHAHGRICQTRYARNASKLIPDRQCRRCGRVQFSNTRSDLIRSKYFAAGRCRPWSQISEKAIAKSSNRYFLISLSFFIASQTLTCVQATCTAALDMGKRNASGSSRKHVAVFLCVWLLVAARSSPPQAHALRCDTINKRETSR